MLRSSLTRRRILFGLAGFAGAAALAGCSSSVAPLTSTTSTTLKNGEPFYTLGARFPDGFNASSLIAAGSPQRAPYVLMGNDGWPATEGVPDSIELAITHNNALLETITVNRHGERGSTPYYPLVFTPPKTGTYEITLVSSNETHFLKVGEASALPMVLVGDALPTLETPTLQNPQGIDPVCSQFDGPCPFHEVTLTEALAKPGPTAVLVSTLGFCQTDVCGPALDVLVAEAARLEEDWSIIHAEVYAAPNSGDFSTAPIVEGLGLPFEPSLYAANADGVVTGVLHLAMDQPEISAALATAV